MKYTNNKNNTSEILKVYIINSITKSYILNIKIRPLVTEYALMIKLVGTSSAHSLKGILSTKIVIFSYPKLLSFSVLTFIKWRLTLSYGAKDTIFWQKKTQNYRYQNYCRMTIFKSIHMAFFVNTSWACALFRNNKQHVVLGQKRKCQLVE